MLRFKLKTQASPCAGRRLAKAAACILAESLADEGLLYDLELVLTEACANVVKHAYCCREGGDLVIRLRIEPRRYVEIEVEDRGIGIGAVPDPVTPCPTSESGRGLYIISRLVDTMSISRRGTRNRMRFRKDIEEGSWKICG
jgi:anti-sigma regulatory factor (Ser/Thr protein kinase)